MRHQSLSFTVFLSIFIQAKENFNTNLRINSKCFSLPNEEKGKRCSSHTKSTPLMVTTAAPVPVHPTSGLPPRSLLRDHNDAALACVWLLVLTHSWRPDHREDSLLPDILQRVSSLSTSQPCSLMHSKNIPSARGGGGRGR